VRLSPREKVSDSADPPKVPQSRPMAGPRVVPHGHQIQAAHRTVLPEEDGDGVRRLAEILSDNPSPLGSKAQVRLARLCGEFPSFLDGWARLAEAAYSSGDLVAAYAYSRVGYHRGLDRLRQHGWGGTGLVEWSQPANRGFLRSLYMLMVVAAAVGEEVEAVRCRQFLLDLDPEDGIGVGGRPPLARGEVVPAVELP